eukprot:6201703-Pleurochrysis_carterae.AAC.2
MSSARGLGRKGTADIVQIGRVGGVTPDVRSEEALQGGRVPHHRTLTTTCGRPRCPHGQGVGVGAEAPVVPGAYPIFSERGVRAVRGCREWQKGLVGSG